MADTRSTVPPHPVLAVPSVIAVWSVLALPSVPSFFR